MGIPADDPYAQQGDPPVWAEYRQVIADSGEKLTLEPLGMITIERRSDIKIPAFSGSLRYEYARPLGASRPMDAQ